MNIRLIFFGLLLLALGYLSYLIISPVLTYLLAALLLAFMLHPLHVRLKPHIGERPSALVLVVFAITAAITPLLIIGYLLVETIEEIAEGLDEVTLIRRAEQLLQSYTGLEIDLMTEIERSLENFAEAALGGVTEVVFATLHDVLGVLLLLFDLYYLILDGPQFVRWLMDVAPLDSVLEEELIDEANVITWAVIKSHLMVAILEGILMGIGFYMAGVPNAPFWTMVMIVLSILPVIGASAIWVPAVLFLVYIGAFPAAIFLFIYGAIILNIENYIRAILVDRDSDLHPAVVLVGVLGGLYVFGVLGLFIGPIILAIFKAVVNVFGRQYAEGDLDLGA